MKNVKVGRDPLPSNYLCKNAPLTGCRFEFIQFIHSFPSKSHLNLLKWQNQLYENHRHYGRTNFTEGCTSMFVKQIVNCKNHRQQRTESGKSSYFSSTVMGKRKLSFHSSSGYFWNTIIYISTELPKLWYFWHCHKILQHWTHPPTGHNIYW